MENEHATQMHDILLANQPEGAKHVAELCPFCVEKASQSTASGIPLGSAEPDVSDHQNTEGGATPTMSDNEMISQETHLALVRQKVDDAVRQSDAALQAMTTKADEATARADQAETELTTVKTENAELNTKLDEAAINLKTATEKAAQLEKDIAEDTAKREVQAKADERASQVKNLGLFEEDYVSEKAGSWAKLDDEAWLEQVESWKKLKTPTGDASSTGDAASAMTGTTEDLTSTGNTDSAAGGADKTPARRKVLGLV